MKRSEFIEALNDPDADHNQKKKKDPKIKVNTSTRFDMEVLSVYYDEQGNINIDVD